MQPLAEHMVGYLSLFFQLGVLALVTVLAAVVRGSIGRRIVDGWVVGLAVYTCGVLLVGIGALGASLAPSALPPPIVTTLGYIVAEQAAALIFIATIRRESGRLPLTPALATLAAAAVTTSAYALVHSATFFDAYRVHAGWLGLLFAIAAFEAARGRRSDPIAVVALTVLAADYLHVPLLTLAGVALPSSYLGLESYFTAILDIALGIAIVVRATDGVRRQLVRRNAELAEAEAALRATVFTDVLCAVGNRAAFLACAASDGGSGTVAMIDLDDLKGINDRYGHAAGDAALAATARALRERLTAAEIFRIGGDEFVAVVRDDDGAAVDALLHAAERDLAILAEDLPQRPRISWGIAAFDAGRPICDALGLADRALYERKPGRRG